MAPPKGALVAFLLAAQFVHGAALSKSRNRHFLHRRALKDPSRSPWAKLWKNGGDEDLIDTIGLDRATATDLYVVFKAIMDGCVHFIRFPAPRTHPLTQPNAHALPCRKVLMTGLRRKKKQRAKTMYSVLDCFGVTLHWMNSTMRQKTLSEVFGMVPSRVSRMISVGLVGMLEALDSFPESAIRWPKRDGMEASAARIEAVYGIKGVFGFVDGLNLKMQHPTDPAQQEMYYNGWTHDCYASNVFVYDSFGALIWATVNAPGSWHDMAIAHDLIQKILTDDNMEGFRIVGDSAFRHDKAMMGRVIVPLKTGALEKLPTPQARAEALRASNLTVTVRQAAEWGMQCIKGPIGRLKMCMTSDSTRRKLVLSVACKFYNFRVRRGMPNQIRTFYDPGHIDAPPRGSERINRFYDKV
jgi:hypothetical protein